MALNLNDSVPQIVSFVFSGRPAEFEDLHYQGVKVTLNESLYATVKLHSGTLEYNRAQQFGVAASLWNITSDENQRSVEVIVALWPFHFADAGDVNITISLDLRLRSWVTSHHPLSGRHKINFYVPSQTSTALPTIDHPTTARTRLMIPTVTTMTATVTNDNVSSIESTFIQSTAGKSVVAVACVVAILLGGSAVIVVLVVKFVRRRKLDADTSQADDKLNDTAITLTVMTCMKCTRTIKK